MRVRAFLCTQSPRPVDSLTDDSTLLSVLCCFPLFLSSSPSSLLAATLYSGEVTSVKHDNLNVLSAYIYRLTVKNDLGASAPTYSMPCTLRQ